MDLGVSLEAGQLGETPRFSGASVSSYDVFSGALASMVIGAKTGLDAPCNGIQDIRGFDIAPERKTLTSDKSALF